jgi:hypothetical protein
MRGRWREMLEIGQLTELDSRSLLPASRRRFSAGPVIAAVVSQPR